MSAKYESRTNICTTCGEPIALTDGKERCGCSPTDGVVHCLQCKKDVPASIYCIGCGKPLVVPLTKTKQKILIVVRDLANTSDVIDIQNIFDSLEHIGNEVIRTYMSQMVATRFLKNIGRGEYTITELGRLSVRVTKIEEIKEIKIKEKIEEVRTIEVPHREKSTIISMSTARRLINSEQPDIRISYKTSVSFAAILEEIGIRIVKTAIANGPTYPDSQTPTPDAIRESARKIIEEMEHA